MYSITGTLSAPGQSVVANNDDGRDSMTCQFTISSINTTVVLQIEASSDGTNWENLDSTGQPTTYRANVTDSFYLVGPVFLLYRLTFVSETGGTTATINVTFNLK